MKPHLKQEACAGKRRWAGFGDAEHEAQRLRRVYGEHSNAYHCPHCNGYHVGTRAILRLRRPRVSHDAS